MGKQVSVILVEDIPGLGAFGDEKKVKAGYANNFLIPQGLVELVNASNTNLIQDIQKKKARYEAQRADHNHLIDSESGKIHEFKDKRLDNLLKKIALEMGYDVVNVKLDVEGKKRGDVECGCIQIKIY